MWIELIYSSDWLNRGILQLNSFSFYSHDQTEEWPIHIHRYIIKQNANVFYIKPSSFITLTSSHKHHSIWYTDFSLFCIITNFFWSSLSLVDRFLWIFMFNSFNFILNMFVTDICCGKILECSIKNDLVFNIILRMLFIHRSRKSFIYYETF